MVRESIGVEADYLCLALGALAALVEEPEVTLTRDALREAVIAHGRFCDALGIERDYAWVGGAAVARRKPSYVIKRPASSTSH